MKQEKTVLKEDWYMVWRYLFYTFTIAWVTEFLLIALYHFNLLNGNIAIVMGSEGKGISALTRKLCDGVVTMKMYGKVNSLNVSVAPGIVLYETVRKRRN